MNLQLRNIFLLHCSHKTKQSWRILFLLHVTTSIVTEQFNSNTAARIISHIYWLKWEISLQGLRHVITFTQHLCLSVALDITPPTVVWAGKNHIYPRRPGGVWLVCLPCELLLGHLPCTDNCICTKQHRGPGHVSRVKLIEQKWP